VATAVTPTKIDSAITKPAKTRRPCIWLSLPRLAQTSKEDLRYDLVIGFRWPLMRA